MNGERKPVALKEGDPTMAMLRRERERERERGGVTQWEINAAVERSVVNIPRPAKGTLAGTWREARKWMNWKNAPGVCLSFDGKFKQY